MKLLLALADCQRVRAQIQIFGMIAKEKSQMLGVQNLLVSLKMGKDTDVVNIYGTTAINLLVNI